MVHTPSSQHAPCLIFGQLTVLQSVPPPWKLPPEAAQITSVIGPSQPPPS